MRLRIRHDIIHRFEVPAKSLLEILRLAPRSFEGQHVVSWRVNVDADCQLKASEDCFGNCTHGFSIAGPQAELSLQVDGEIETFDMAGVVRGAPERFPPELFLRETPDTIPDAELRDFAKSCVSGQDGDLGRSHALMDAMAAQTPGDAELGRNAAHRFIACARFLRMPARFVSGYFLQESGAAALHGWAEAHLGSLGWIGFDPTHGICPQERHVRLACGLDYWGAAPLRNAQGGGWPVAAEMAIAIVEAGGRTQA